MQTMISPVVSSMQNIPEAVSIVRANKLTQEVFAFIPGLAKNKFSSVDLDGLTSISFFDVPVTEYGQLNKNSRGYSSFKSHEALDLFDRARYSKTKILLTLTQSDYNSLYRIVNDPQVEDTLITQAIQEVKNSKTDGVTIDFEYLVKADQPIKEKFVQFLSDFSQRIHSEIPGSQLALALPDFAIKDGSIKMDALAKASDRIFIMAYNNATPEFRNAKAINPVFGLNEHDYWQNISSVLKNFSNVVPAQKLVLERAWYGNGDNYPLYVPPNQPQLASFDAPTESVLDDATLNKLVKGVPAKGKQGAMHNIPLIVEALDQEGILDSNVLAYALATVEHETDGTFEPVEEIQGRFSARRFGYEGGTNYFGRGFIQITHLRNYKIIGERIGVGEQLVENPALATDPKIAAKVLAAYFKDNNVAQLASRGNFIAARMPINPDYKGRTVAALAMKYDIYQ